MKLLGLKPQIQSTVHTLYVQYSTVPYTRNKSKIFLDVAM